MSNFLSKIVHILHGIITIIFSQTNIIAIILYFLKTVDLIAIIHFFPIFSMVLI